MIDKKVFLKAILLKAKKLPIGNYLDIRSYKRNRRVLFIRKDETNYHLIEKGFFELEFHITYDELNAHFKKILKREFPRSHKIRIYNMGAYSEAAVEENKRKKI